METWRTAAYLRLSREDGDKVESDSIANQHKQLEQYLAEHPELELVDYYADDGYTGTNFDRPALPPHGGGHPSREGQLCAGEGSVPLRSGLHRNGALSGEGLPRPGGALHRCQRPRGQRAGGANDMLCP